MQGTNRILVLRLRGGCCSQVEQPFWKSLFLLSWFRLEPLSYGGGCDDPASSGGWESYLSLYYRCPAGVASSFVIGNTWVCYYKSTAHGFHGRFREREIAWKPCSLLLVLRNDHRSVPAEIQHSIYCPSMHTYTTTLLTH